MNKLLMLLGVAAILAISLPAYSDESTVDSQTELSNNTKYQALNQLNEGIMFGNGDDTDTLVFMTKNDKYFEFILSNGAIVKAYEINKEKYDDWKRQHTE